MPIQWGRTYSNFSMGTIKFDFIFDILLFLILYYAKLYLVFHNRLYHINHNMDLLSISEINWDFWIDTIIYSLILLKNCVADLLLPPICIHGLSTKGARIWLSILLVDSRCDFFVYTDLIFVLELIQMLESTVSDHLKLWHSQFMWYEKGGLLAGILRGIPLCFIFYSHRSL